MIVFVLVAANVRALPGRVCLGDAFCGSLPVRRWGSEGLWYVGPGFLYLANRHVVISGLRGQWSLGSAQS